MADLGYDVLDQNVRVGRLEIDIVARDRGTLVICEVRARRHSRWLHPASTITPAKQRRLRAAAAGYRKSTATQTGHTRFDVAAVMIAADNSLTIEYFKNAF